MTKPWDQQPNESSKAFERFALYRDMGAGRSLHKLAKDPELNPSTLAEISSKHNWQERVSAFDASIDKASQHNASSHVHAALIHESRLTPFHATPSLNLRQWTSSILQRIYPVLQQFQTAWQATKHLMTDAAQGIFKFKGLHSAVASNRTEELLKRMKLVDMNPSISRSILLDAEDEEFRRDSYGFSGIPEILEKMMLRLVAAARLPVSLLMGQAPQA